MSYPFIAWLGLRIWSPQIAAGLLFLVIAPAGLSRMKARNRSAVRSLWVVPLSSALLLLLASALDSRGLVLLVPTAMSAGLLLVFGSTLLRPPPIIERFARLVHELTPSERVWCRAWTWIWCGFFFFNGAMAAWLTWYGNEHWWRTYNGAVAYVLMGLLFGGEYITRKYRFGRLKEHWLDRGLRSAFDRMGRPS
jgi:uncharacterized membrane protein